MDDFRNEAALLGDVRTIMRDTLGRDDADAIGPETRFFADLGLASIDAVVLGEALQSHYGRILPFGELMSNIGTRADRDLVIGDLLEFLREHLSD